MAEEEASWFAGSSVHLEELLAARDERAAMQRSWCKAGESLIVLNVVTPGDVKNHAFSRAVFAQGKAAVEMLCREYAYPITLHHTRHVRSGETAYWRVVAPAAIVKKALIDREEAAPLGRLWDLDVLDEKGQPLSRRNVGNGSRRCLVCEDEAKICARERRHPIEQLHNAMFKRFYSRIYARRIAQTMQEALIREACLTPKPGLVDGSNNRCHPDMDVQRLIKSAQALSPYLAAMAEAGMMHAGMPSPELLARIRPIGRRAEVAMFSVTGGINTHKGAIFIFGIYAAVLGWRFWHELAFERKETAAQIAAVCAELRNELGIGDSAGQKMYRRFGLTGVRGEAATGFSLVEKALAAYERSAFPDENARWRLALLALIAANDDTTTLSRSDLDTLRSAQEKARQYLERHGAADCPQALDEDLRSFDDWAIRRHLSFGGSADLLALSIFLRHFQTMEERTRNSVFDTASADFLFFPNDGVFNG